MYRRPQELGLATHRPSQASGGGAPVVANWILLSKLGMS
jgi:hypothetical protein